MSTHAEGNKNKRVISNSDSRQRNNMHVYKCDTEFLFLPEESYAG